jgi:hypothetical protein
VTANSQNLSHLVLRNWKKPTIPRCIAGKVRVRIRPETSIVRRVLLKCVLWIRENTGTRIISMNVPKDLLVEAGFIKNVWCLFSIGDLQSEVG